MNVELKLGHDFTTFCPLYIVVIDGVSCNTIINVEPVIQDLKSMFGLDIEKELEIILANGLRGDILNLYPDRSDEIASAILKMLKSGTRSMILSDVITPKVDAVKLQPLETPSNSHLLNF